MLLALGRNGYNAVKAAAAMMLGIGLAPVFFRSLFYMLIIFIVMLIVMETCRKPRIQDESKVKAAIPEFSTGNFLQNLEYQLRMIHLADTAEQVRFSHPVIWIRWWRGIRMWWTVAFAVCVFWRRRHGESLTGSAWK